MANRQFNGRVRTPHSEPVHFAFYFPVDGSSVVGTQSLGSLSYVTVTKPAGTGIYRCTFADCFTDVLHAKGSLLVAAGTLDRKIDPVAVTNAGTATPLVVDFQVRKSSDGTAVDPVSMTIYIEVFLRNSQVTP